MKKMSEIKKMTNQELNEYLLEIKKEKLNLKVHAKTGQLSNFSRIRQIKLEISRINTEKSIRYKINI